MSSPAHRSTRHSTPITVHPSQFGSRDGPSGHRRKDVESTCSKQQSGVPVERPQRPATSRARSTSVERRHRTAARPFSTIRCGLTRGHDQLRGEADTPNSSVSTPPPCTGPRDARWRDGGSVRHARPPPPTTRLSAPDRRPPSHDSTGGVIPDARRGGRLPQVHLGYRRALPPELNELVRGDDRGCDERQGEHDHPLPSAE